MCLLTFIVHFKSNYDSTYTVESFNFIENLDRYWEYFFKQEYGIYTHVYACLRIWI